MGRKLTRTEIIENSKSLFNRYGFKKITMGDLASELKISRPTLYSHFTDKQALFTACVAHEAEVYKNKASTKIANLKKLDEQLRSLFEIYVVQPYVEFSKSAEKRDILKNAETYAPESMLLYWKGFEELTRNILKSNSNDLDLPASQVAKILVSFGRDARIFSASTNELKKLIETAIQMALQSK